MEFEALRAAIEAAESQNNQIIRQRDFERSEALRTVDAKWEPARAAAAAKVYEAKAELQRALDERARNGEGAVLPLGAIYIEWGMGLWDREFRPTGRRAVVELFKIGDAMPENLRYCVPEVGRTVLRELKKDGSPGRRVHLVGRNGALPVYWRPEGVNFNGERR